MIGLLDPLNGSGYQLWSGIGAVFIDLFSAAMIALAIWLYPTRCTQFGCRRRARKATIAGVAFCQQHYDIATAEVKD